MSEPPSRWVRSALELCGMLSPSGYPRLYLVFMVYGILATAYCFGGSLAYFIVMEGATTEKLQSIQINITILSGLIKRINAALQQKKLNSLLLDFDGLWIQLYCGRNKEIMDNSGKSCKLLYKIYNYIMFFIPTSSIVMGLFFHLFMGVNQLTLQIYMPFNEEKYYIPIEIVQTLLSISPLLANSSSFLLYLVASEQVATYLRVIRRKLREEKLSKQAIREHQQIIKLLDDFNDLFSWLLYLEITAVSVECSSSAYTLYKVHIKEGQRENVVANLINFVFCFFIPYVICYSGRKITTESNLLFRDAYNGTWYEHDLKAKKDFKMVMLSASKTLNLHYKNIAVFGMELFTSIINVTFSVFNAIIWLDHADQDH